MGNNSGVPLTGNTGLGGISRSEVDMQLRLMTPEELQEIRDVFEYVDQDGNNAISLEELEELFSNLPEPISKYDLTRMFNLLDQDDDGTIDFFEFACMVRRITAEDKEDTKGEHESVDSERNPKDQYRKPLDLKYKRFDLFDPKRYAKEKQPPPVTIREKVWATFDDPTSSTLAYVVSIVVMALIAISCLMFILESVEAIVTIPGAETFFATVETFCVLGFTVEFVCRVTTTPSLISFCLGALNWIDLIAILPWYAAEIPKMLNTETVSNDEDSDESSTSFVRVLRLIRVFRVFKFSRYLVWVRLIGAAFVDSLLPLGMAMFMFSIGLIIFASVVFNLEKTVMVWDEEGRQWVYNLPGDPADGTVASIQSIVSGIYFVTISMTTVGYGDQRLYSPGAKVVGMFNALMGICLLAIPISVFSTNFEIQFQQHLRSKGEENEEAMEAAFLSAITTARDAILKLKRKVSGTDEGTLLELMKYQKRTKRKKHLIDDFDEDTLPEHITERIVEAVHYKRLEMWTKIERMQREHVVKVCRRLAAFFDRQFPVKAIPEIPGSGEEIKRRRATIIERLQSQFLSDDENNNSEEEGHNVGVEPRRRSTFFMMVKGEDGKTEKIDILNRMSPGQMERGGSGRDNLTQPVNSDAKLNAKEEEKEEELS